MGFGQQRAEAATPLQAARFEIDWKQSQTLRELKRLAEVDKIPIASDASLKTMLSVGRMVISSLIRRTSVYYARSTGFRHLNLVS
jgi:hypothetical protein